MENYNHIIVEHLGGMAGLCFELVYLDLYTSIINRNRESIQDGHDTNSAPTTQKAVGLLFYLGGNSSTVFRRGLEWKKWKTWGLQASSCPAC